MRRIWIDIEDMFQYAGTHHRPSGIQRVEYELCRALAQLPESRDLVGFVRHARARNALHTVPYATFAALYDRMTDTPAAPPPARAMAAAAARPGEGRLHRLLVKRVVYRLPARLRLPLGEVWRGGRASAAAWAGLLRALPPQPGAAALAAPRGEDFSRMAKPGDILAVLGSPWFHPDYAGLVGQARQRQGVSFALLIYDLIPLRRPEWCHRSQIEPFGPWMASVLPIVDTLLAISHATAADIVRYADQQGIRLRAPPLVIPMGTGFGNHAAAAAAETPRSPRLPPAGSYALVVATIEARKNHALLFRVWRRLLDEMPADQVPTLVFAGRVGWLVADLMTQLHNSRFLDGRIVLVDAPTDAELAQLYAGCRFTLFPSLYEGWGLPVSESLGFGRPCLAARATALPEAGGDLARYFDPDSVTDACRVIRATIEDPDGLAAWQRRIAAEFVPVPWTQSARAVLEALG